jgi:tRNA(fMet)-specific endonuclease VapC
MKYLLDTNICILLIRQKSQAVLQRLTRLPLTDVAVSAITIAELRYGVAKSRYVVLMQESR